MPRVLLLVPTGTYRATDFVAAATRLGADVVVGSEHRQALARAMGDRAVVVPLAHPGAAVDAIVALHGRVPLDAVVAVDDQGVVIAAAAAERLGLRHNPPDAAAVTRDKGAMRWRLAAGSLPQPDYRLVPPGGDAAAAASAIGYPCVVKPVSRSGSQGVIRVDDNAQADAASVRVRAMLNEGHEVLLVERFVPGQEVAVEGLLREGLLEVLAVFDK
ncbi:MAG TPA: ATP-grasp domain-containing protein, partial [Acidimicrobiales bacterium]|nr:ATP-grasp domain-containing protein [Acidimicrobiales bacterium]